MNTKLNVVDLPNDLRVTYKPEQAPLWTPEQNHETFVKWGQFVAKAVADGKKAPTAGEIIGGSVVLYGNELTLGKYRTSFPYKLVPGLVSRWNSPQWTEVDLIDPKDMQRVFGETANIIDETDGDLSGEYVLLGLHKTGQLMSITTGGMPQGDIAESEDTLLANAADRLDREAGLKIEAARTHKLAWWVKDGDMNHLMRRVTFRCSADWIRDSFANRPTDAFTHLLIVPRNLEAIERVCQKYRVMGLNKQNFYIPWKWIVPIAQRAYGVAA
jgi:hypothetical protein